MRNDPEREVSASDHAHDEPIPDAPTSETEAMLADARQRRQRALLVLGGVLVLTCTAAVVGLVTAQREKEKKLAESWGALSRCLWGEVLAEGQSPGTRVRAGQLITMAIPENKRAEAGAAPWPMRCSNHAFAVKERLHDTGRDQTDGKVLAGAAAELGEALKEPKSVYAPIAPIVDRVVDEANKLHLVALPPAERVPDPPAGPAPLTIDALAKVTPLSSKPIELKSVMAEFITDSELRLLLRDSDKGPELCSLGAGNACRPLPESMRAAAAGLRFAGTVEEGAAPILVGERDGKAGVFRSDTGDKLGAFATYGAYARKDGTATLLGFDDSKEKIVLTRFKPGAAPVEERIDPEGNTGNGYYNLGMLWDQLVWKAVKDDQIHVFSRPVKEGGEMAGKLSDLGAISEPSRVENKEDEEPHVTGCRTPEALIARVKGWSSQFLIFNTSNQWSFPVRVAGRGGMLTCKGAEATITWISERIAGGGGRVLQTRCTAAGCKPASVKGDELIGTVREIAPVDAAQTAAADLDGKLLFLWVAGPEGGLRMKLAPVDQLGKTQDVVLYDPLVQQGKLGATSTLYDMRLFVRGSSAYALLNTAAGVYAIRIGADGAFAPVAVTR